MVSFPLGFILNKFIVFTNSALRGRVQLFRYGLTVISCVGLNYLFLKVFVEGFHWFATPRKCLQPLSLLCIVTSHNNIFPLK
jgi:putative flippase GtrA